MYRIYSKAELHLKRRQEGAVIRAGRRDDDEAFYSALSALYSGGDIDRMLAQRLVPPNPWFIFAAVADALGILLTAFCLLLMNVFSRLEELINISRLLLEGVVLLLVCALIAIALIKMLGAPVQEHGRRAWPLVFGILLLPVGSWTAMSILAVNGNRGLEIFTFVTDVIGSSDPRLAAFILIGCGLILLLILLYGMTAIPFDPVTRYVRVYRAMRPRWLLREDTSFEDAKAFWAKRSTGDLSALLNSYGRAGCIEEAEWERSAHPDALAEVIGDARDKQKAEREKAASPETGEDAGTTAAASAADPAAAASELPDGAEAGEAAPDAPPPAAMDPIFVPVTAVTDQDSPLGKRSADYAEPAPLEASSAPQPAPLEAAPEEFPAEGPGKTEDPLPGQPPLESAETEVLPEEPNDGPEPDSPTKPFSFPKFPWEPFYMLIDTCDAIPGIGCALTGKVGAGMLRAGSDALLCGYGRDPLPVVVEQITLFRAEMPYCQAGDPVSLLVTGMRASDYINGLTLERPVPKADN